jgi:glycosyltransferase involved in cell wall biosynthesis
MAPTLSVCIPTYNRADILDHCLTQLTPLQDCGKSVEIVLSDNASTDRTPEVVAAHCAGNPLIRAYRLPEGRTGAQNWLNALHQAQGQFMTYLADDDGLMVDGLMQHVERLEREPDLVAIFTDWIAWDDQSQREMHRNWAGLEEFTSFTPDQPLDLVNFMFKRILPPEVAVYRREALLRALRFHSLSLPHYSTLYRLSRQGRVAFDPLPFYLEKRELKAGLERTHWANMDLQLQMVGDQLRLALEEFALLALQDAGNTSINEQQAAVIRQSIDRMLHGRIGLEVTRACARRDWILAVELRRRFTLWHGPGSDDTTRQDVLRIVIPAALQAIHQTFRSLSNVAGLCLKGFESARIFDFFRQSYPDTPILAAETIAPGGAGALIVHRDERSLAQDNSIADGSGVLVLERLLDMYRIGTAKIDIRGF